MKTWATIDEAIPYQELDDSHLLNIIKWIKRKAKSGISIIEHSHDMGYETTETENLWTSEVKLMGGSVLDYYDYENLYKEALHRGLLKEK